MISYSQLQQIAEHEDVEIASGQSTSQTIASRGARGLAIAVPPAWTAADIGFYAVSGDLIIPLRDTEGAKVVITGIATSEANVYIAPASCWALGAFPAFKIASLNTSTGTLINQAAKRELKIFFLR